MWREKILNRLAPPSRLNANARLEDCSPETTHFQRPMMTGGVRVLPESRCRPQKGDPPAQIERRVHACSPGPVLWSEPVAVDKPQRPGCSAHLSGRNLGRSEQGGRRLGRGQEDCNKITHFAERRGLTTVGCGPNLLPLPLGEDGVRKPVVSRRIPW